MQDTRTTLVIAVAANVAEPRARARSSSTGSTRASPDRRGARSLAQVGAAVAFLVIVAPASARDGRVGLAAARRDPDRGRRRQPAHRAHGVAARRARSSRRASRRASATSPSPRTRSRSRSGRSSPSRSTRSRSPGQALVGPVPRRAATRAQAPAPRPGACSSGESCVGVGSRSCSRVAATRCSSRCSPTTPAVQRPRRAGARGSSRSLQPLGARGVRARRHPHRRRRRAVPGARRWLASTLLVFVPPSRWSPSLDGGLLCPLGRVLARGSLARWSGWAAASPAPLAGHRRGARLTHASATGWPRTRTAADAVSSDGGPASERGAGTAQPSSLGRSRTGRATPGPDDARSGPIASRRPGVEARWRSCPSPRPSASTGPMIRSARATSTRGVAASTCARSPAASTTRSTGTGSAAEWEGLEHVPREGGALLVANHAARSRPTRR